MSQTIYPTWRYCSNGAKKLIHSASEEPSGSDWSDKPFPPQPKPEPETVESLKEKLSAAVSQLQAKQEELEAAQAETAKQADKFDIAYGKLPAENTSLRAKLKAKGKPAEAKAGAAEDKPEETSAE
jgi:hypothetical protein